MSEKVKTGMQVTPAIQPDVQPQCKPATKDSIQKAAEIIANGGIAAFPTETVYGLGADASNPAAVSRIYSAKGRPGDNPLILHVAAPEAFAQLTVNTPAYAQALINAFWPGPLTLVANKKTGLPTWLGGSPKGETETIGVRMPSHPVALAVIKASGCVIAAPSANKAGTPSPTHAGHVVSDFADGSIDFILDGGSVPGGLESTVVDVTGTRPRILRPGAITAEMIEDITGIKPHGFEPITGLSPNNNTGGESSAPPRSPGMKYRHYAPKAPMTLLMGSEDGIAEYIMSQIVSELKNRHIGVLVATQTRAKIDESSCTNLFNCSIITLGDKTVPETIARNLYAGLRQFDILGVDIIFAEGFAQEGLGIAIMDRMKKAAEGRVVCVPDKNNVCVYG